MADASYESMTKQRGTIIQKFTNPIGILVTLFNYLQQINTVLGRASDTRRLALWLPKRVYCATQEI